MKERIVETQPSGSLLKHSPSILAIRPSKRHSILIYNERERERGGIKKEINPKHEGRELGSTLNKYLGAIKWVFFSDKRVKCQRRSSC